MMIFSDRTKELRLVLGLLVCMMFIPIITACGVVQGSECLADVDCAKNQAVERYCVKGVCKANPPASTCSEECPKGFVCVGQICQYLGKTFPKGQIPTPNIHAVGGATYCQTYFQGRGQGTLAVRLTFADESKQAVPPHVLKKLGLQAGALSVVGSTVYDAETGDESKKVSALVSIESGMSFHTNPAHIALEKQYGSFRIPKSTQLFVDMSEVAGDVDAPRTRTASLASFVLDAFNHGMLNGPYDLFSVSMFRKKSLQEDDLLLLPHQTTYQHSALAPKGFYLSRENVLMELSEELTRLSPANIDGGAPLYEAISTGVSRLLALRKTPLGRLSIPGVILLSVDKDISLRDPKQATAEYSLSSVTKELTYSTVPLMTILYPPVKMSYKEWKMHYENVCALVNASQSDGVSYGQQYAVPPSARRRFGDDARQFLDSSFHAMSGYTGAKVSYQLKGAEPGKRYIVKFTLQSNWRGKLSEVAYPITFEVSMP